MAEATVKLTFGSFSVEVSGSPEYVDKKLEELLKTYGPSGRIVSLEGRSAPAALPAADATGKKIGPGEFLRRAPSQNQSDQALSLGFYLEKVEGMQSFTTADLGKVATAAKRKFANVSDVVGKLASRGLLMSVGTKEGHRAYSLTASGEEYVESESQSDPET
jgi:hypothetical protein